MRNSKSSLWIKPSWVFLPSFKFFGNCFLACKQCKCSMKNFFPELFSTLCPQCHLVCVFYKQGLSFAVQSSAQETDALILSSLQNYMLHFVVMSLFWNSTSVSLIFMTLAIFNITSQLFYRTYLNLGLSDLSLGLDFV